MSELRITGGLPLSGTVDIHGAKNSVLPILAATLLSRGECVIHNCPRLSDVDASLRILHHLGCPAVREGETVTVDARCPTGYAIPDHLMREMRSSVIFLGAVLARMGRAQMNLPGGCELGPRPIDLHLAALRQLGAHIDQCPDGLYGTAGQLTGCRICLRLPSVGATENIMLAACAARGQTVICNAAREPEIADLQTFLNAMGGQVCGAGSATVTVQGGCSFHGAEHRVMADRIVAATYLSAAAAAGGDVTVCGVDWRHLAAVSGVLKQAGCRLDSGSDWVRLRRTQRLRGGVHISTAPYPGFPTDAQAPVMAALVCAEGESSVTENLFDSRYRHVDRLRSMGADIRLEGRRALIRGVEQLHGARVQATDLRCAGALAAAAVGARGESVITGLNHLDRGYAAAERDLRELGAQVVRRET